MELTTFIMILVVAIVFSNLLDSAFPKFPLPLVQIGCGVLIALTPLETRMTINPELFMGLLVAPLLFRESEEADMLALWKIRKTVVFMVFGLVFATVFVIGFAVHELVPAIPLAACFCLGAVLGPTDAIAVSSVSNRIEIPDRIMHILKGEFLINDASGVISFNFAALALVTGSFSLLDAGLAFLVLCAGGFAVGFVIALVKRAGMQALKRGGIHSTAAFMLIEILTPFLSFFLAEEIGVSGIIAAVTAGSMQAFGLRKLEMFEAEFSTLKKSIWEMITVVFNSFIFILLGLQLPSIIRNVTEIPAYSIGFAMLVGLFATGVLFAVRFVGVVFGARDIREKSQVEKLRSWAILTLSGVKGTVSLATAFSLPLAFASGKVFVHRDFLLFVTSCAIIYSLVISTLLLPVIAKPKAPRKRNRVMVQIIREIIPVVEASEGTCAGSVAQHLKRRARALEYEDLGTAEKRLVGVLRQDFFRHELALMEKLRKKGEVTHEEYAAYCSLFAVFSALQEGSLLRRLLNRMRFSFRLLGRTAKAMQSLAGGTVDGRRMQEIFWSNTGHISEILDRKYGKRDDPILSRVVEERVDIATAVFDRAFGETLEHHLHEEYDREIKRCFGLEREILSRYEMEGRISEDEADMIRVEINKLETYAIEEVHSDVSKRLIVSRANRRKTAVKRRLAAKRRLPAKKS
ncbi:MAG: sodium:proton antiporter [Clostridiales Family XIII bacterium]|jgi:CPA1 family monovalent cation:H+ antiporter|nr:sodium:proton antiporter [Clostridiales Family XIII bacterium]